MVNGVTTDTKKYIQVIACSDDIVITPRSRRSLGGASTEFKKKAEIRGLMINQRETKYLICSRKNTSNIYKIKICEQVYEERKFLNTWEWW